MIALAAAALGALAGVATARRRGGNRLDMAHYGAGFAIAFGLAGMVVTVLLSRML